MGQPLSMHRFRGNIWVDGWAPWSELDLIGQEITIGTARLRVEEPIGRCRATGANPETGVQDADTMGALEAGYGHTDFGVFARVIEGGTSADRRRGADMSMVFTLAPEPEEERARSGG
jgi:uncharacterized protein